MPFDVIILKDLEDALSECFKYHDDLDTFLIRSGISQAFLNKAREKADQKMQQARTSYSRAPKRYVVRELLNLLSSLGKEGDKQLEGIIAGITRSIFKEASQTGITAVNRLIASDQQTIKKERENTQREKEQAAEKARQHAYLKSQKERDNLRERFINLIDEKNAHSRGYQFETFLNDLFKMEGLTPRSPFRNAGEQIDVSFSWRSQTHLVEAKWVTAPVSGAEFGAFSYKIEGKTADTRGLYISVNGYSPQAIQSLNGKGSLKFICIDGAHLMRAFMAGKTLIQILETVWRNADETGEAYFEVSRFKND